MVATILVANVLFRIKNIESILKSNPAYFFIFLSYRMKLFLCK